MKKVRTARQKVISKLDKMSKVKQFKKLPTVKALKDKAWKLCSEFIRRKDASPQGLVKCYTCNAVKHWKEMQAGHFVAGRGNAILFDERGLRPQCLPCNVFKHGDPITYMIELEKEVGKESAMLIRDELKRLSRIPRTFQRHEIEFIISNYEKRIANL